MAALLVLAGCAGGVPNASDESDSAASDDGAAETGQMNFYVSDEPNAMDDFEHLNVTITAVAFHKADASADSDGAASEDESDADETTTAETVTDDGDANATTTETVTDDGDTNATTTETDDGDETTTTTEEVESEETESEKSGEVADKAESDEWVVKEVDEQTVDLTKLKGENATMLSQFDIPAGEYDVAMVYVSDVNATLKTGEQVNVKLPSEKLQVKTPFTVGANESVDFVFDISVHEAGKSGKYILKPVVSESGANVEKRVVDKNGKPVGDDEKAEYDLSVDGNLTAGEEATVTVTDADGEPVEGAEVKVNGEVVGETDADGQVTFSVPDAEDVEIEAESEAGEGSVEVELGGDSEADDDSRDGDESADDKPDVELAAALATDVRAGENATIVVTDGNGTAVEDAVVEVNGEVVGETNADGELTFTVPEDAEDVEIVVTKGDAEIELEHGVVAAASA